MGQDSIVQLWDAESYQPLGQPFHLEDSEAYTCYMLPEHQLITHSPGLLWIHAVTLQQTVLLLNHQDTLTCGFPMVLYVLQSSSHLVVKFCFYKLFSEQKISCIVYTNLTWPATLPYSVIYPRYHSLLWTQHLHLQWHM